VSRDPSAVPGAEAQFRSTKAAGPSPSAEKVERRLQVRTKPTRSKRQPPADRVPPRLECRLIDQSIDQGGHRAIPCLCNPTESGGFVIVGGGREIGPICGMLVLGYREILVPTGLNRPSYLFWRVLQDQEERLNPDLHHDGECRLTLNNESRHLSGNPGSYLLHSTR